MPMAMLQLQILHTVFNVEKTAGTVFNIDLIRLDELLHLPASEVECSRYVPGLLAVDEGVPMCFHGSP